MCDLEKALNGKGNMTLQEEQLKRPFEAHEIEWKVQQSGEKNGKCWAMVLAYVTNRAIMDRLDEVFGIGGWRNEYFPTPSIDGVMCGISAKIDNEWITKYDGAENTQIEAVKGGLSSSMKRTAVQFGIGRYLYHLESNFAKIVDNRQDGTKSAKTKNNIWFNWLPPELPPFALPIMKNQENEIKILIKETEANEAKLKEYFNFIDLKNISKETATKIILQLKKKQVKQNENNTN